MFQKSLCIFALILAVCSADYKTRYSGDKLYRVTPLNDDQVAKLKALMPYKATKGALDFWTYPRARGLHVDIRVQAGYDAEFQQFLTENHLRHELRMKDVQKMINGVDFINHQLQLLRGPQANNSIVGTFAAHADINNWLSQQCANYSSIAKCGSMGLSYQGRDMRYIKLGSASSQPKKAIYIISGMHAREWLGPATIVWIINKFVTSYASDPQVKQLLDTFDWYIEPVVNPDGYEYTRSDERLWRKTRGPTPDSDCIGVDGNRNFDFHWDGSGDPCDETYPGTDAFSEKETTNLRNFFSKLDQSNGLAFFSVHTYSSVWLLPYGYAENTYPSDYNELLRAGTVGVKALMAVNKTSWQIGNIVDLLYVAAGNSADWFKGRSNAVYSYALELRGDSFIVPASQIDPSGAEVYAGFVAAVATMKQ